MIDDDYGGEYIDVGCATRDVIPVVVAVMVVGAVTILLAVAVVWRIIRVVRSL